MSTDWRDAADLTGFEWPFSAYAPGDYMGVCHGCGDHVGGLDKRALLCLRCAMAAMRENYLALEQALRIRIWNDAKGKGISDRAAMVEVEEGIRKAAQWDRSGEADETRRGSAEGESPVDGEAGDAPDPLTPSNPEIPNG